MCKQLSDCYREQSEGNDKMSDTKKYYWLKLKRDFFKRHDIKIIESMENGKDYVLFYMKLLLESVDHDGALRFSETIPYNEKMLATITDTNIDIVRSAVRVFAELGMMEQLDDGTLYMSQVAAMVGSETSDAIRMRRIRQDKKQVLTGQQKGEHCSEAFKNRSPELELELEKELEKDKENIRGTPNKSATRTTFSKPTFDQVKEYCIERKNTVNADKWYAHYESNGWMVGKNKMKDWKAAVRTWEHNNYDSKTTGYKKPLRDLSGGYTLDDAVYNDEGVI
jgi:predicted phage replisome organizer